MNAKRHKPDTQEPLPLTPLQRELLAVMRADREQSWTYAEALRAVAGSGELPVSWKDAKRDFRGLHDRGLLELADDSPRTCREMHDEHTTFKAAST